MVERIKILIKKVRYFFSRSHLLISLLGLTSSDKFADNKGLVLIQIDALSKRHLEKALQNAEMPFLKQLLCKHHYRLHTHYSGMPCSTAAVQAELFYGVKAAVPAFSFRSQVKPCFYNV